MTAHVLSCVDAGSPAERAGMRNGEVLLEVNGESAESLQHHEIVDRVKKSGQHLYLTTIVPQGLEFYTQVGCNCHNVLFNGAVLCLRQLFLSEPKKYDNGI